MRVNDIMTTSVVTFTKETLIVDAARLLLEHHISAAPVVTTANDIVGVISEGDFLRRAQGDDHRRSWWLRLISDPGLNATDYVKVHGGLVGDVMTKDVITVTEDMSVSKVAHLLEAERIKRVPVARDGKLVGIVSRADILRSLAARRDASAAASPTDKALRAEILAQIGRADWAPSYGISVNVTDGAVQIWGVVDTGEQRAALRVLAENVAGVKQVELHLGSIPARAWAQ